MCKNVVPSKNEMLLHIILTCPRAGCHDSGNQHWIPTWNGGVYAGDSKHCLTTGYCPGNQEVRAGPLANGDTALLLLNRDTQVWHLLCTFLLLYPDVRLSKCAST